MIAPFLMMLQLPSVILPLVLVLRSVSNVGGDVWDLWRTWLSLSLLLPPHGFAEWSGETETLDLWANTGILDDPFYQIWKEMKVPNVIFTRRDIDRFRLCLDGLWCLAPGCTVPQRESGFSPLHSPLPPKSTPPLLPSLAPSVPNRSTTSVAPLLEREEDSSRRVCERNEMGYRGR